MNIQENEQASEGMDFADNQARLVLVVGIPYPPAKDARVLLKRDYLDRRRQAANKPASQQSSTNASTSVAPDVSSDRVRNCLLRHVVDATLSQRSRLV